MSRYPSQMVSICEIEKCQKNFNVTYWHTQLLTKNTEAYCILCYYAIDDIPLKNKQTAPSSVVTNSRLAVNPPKSQTSEVRIPDGDKITKSHSSEVSIHRKALYPTFRKLEVSFPRIVITPSKVPSPGQSRKCHCSEFLFLQCPSYTDIDVLLTPKSVGTVDTFVIASTKDHREMLPRFRTLVTHRDRIRGKPTINLDCVSRLSNVDASRAVRWSLPQ